MLEQSGVTLPLRYFGGIAVVHFLLATCHLYFVFYSALRFLSEPIHAHTSTFVSFPSRYRTPWFGERFLVFARHRRVVELRARGRFVYVHMFTRRGILGVDNPYFNHVFILRETFQLTLQIYQAYTMSLALTRTELKGFFVGIVVLNCWFASIVHYFVESEATRRLLCRLANTVLDFISSVGVSVIVALSYVKDYVPSENDLNPALWGDRAWVINLLIESRYLVLASWLDAFSQLVFALSLLFSLRNVRNLLAPQGRGVAPISRLRRIWNASLVPFHAKTTRVRPTTYVRNWSALPRFVRLGNGLLCVAGVFILIAHLHSELRTPPPSYCGLGIWPWFATKPACATITANCCTNCQLTGQATQLDKFLASFQASALRELTIRHCTHIEFGPRLQTFPNLQSLGIYNSTVLRWDSDAELVDAAHPLLSFAYFVRTQFANGTLPMGFAASTFPRMVNRLQFLLTNLATIPFDIHDRWPQGLELDLDLSELREVPSALTKAQISWLSLSFNHITSVPPELITCPSLRVLLLNGNPIRELPNATDPSAIALTWIVVAFTDLSSLPSWAHEASTDFLAIVAGNTPLCDEITSRNVSVEGISCWADGFDRDSYQLAAESFDSQI